MAMDEVYSARAEAVVMMFRAEHYFEHEWCAADKARKRQIARDSMTARLASASLAGIIERHTRSLNRGRLNRLLRSVEALHAALMSEAQDA